MSTRRTLSTLILALWFGGQTALAAEEVNLYSARKEQLIKPLLDRFTAETGIRVNLVTGKESELLARLTHEGVNTPADLLITSDAGNLHRAKEAGVLQPIQSAALNQAVPAHYRDPAGHWVGLSVRARTLFYAKDRVQPGEIANYADLADPKWRGRVCVRSSDNIYNQSLVAAMIARQGVEATEQWIGGLVKNFARPPKGGDRDQIQAVAAGQCDIALANTYYYGGMLSSNQPAEREAATKVGLIWADQKGNGTHVNISGGGVTKYARNKAHAIQLLEFLVSDASQQWYAEANNEFPVKPGVAQSALLKGWGGFKADKLDLHLLGVHNAEAVKAMDRAGWR